MSGAVGSLPVENFPDPGYIGAGTIISGSGTYGYSGYSTP